MPRIVEFPIPEERSARLHWLTWYQKELVYVDNKFDDQRNGHDEEMRTQGISDESFWFRQIFQYVPRARLMGLDTPNGRQALAKMCMTAIGCLESCLRVHGPLPEPGQPSGYITDWTDAPKISDAERALYGDRRTT